MEEREKKTLSKKSSFTVCFVTRNVDIFQHPEVGDVSKTQAEVTEKCCILYLAQHRELYSGSINNNVVIKYVKSLKGQD